MCILFIYEGESNEKLKYFYLVIYWTQKVHNNFIFVCSLHCVPSSVPARRKCMDTPRKKVLLTESAAIRAPLAAPLRWTWKTCLPSPLWGSKDTKVTGGEVWRVRRMWKTLKGQILDCCNNWTGSMGPRIVMLERNTCTQTSTSFGLDCRMQVIL